MTRKSSLEINPQKLLCEAPGPVEGGALRKSKFVYIFSKSRPIKPKFLLPIGTKSN
jgi:hypothetical protein